MMVSRRHGKQRRRVSLRLVIVVVALVAASALCFIHVAAMPPAPSGAAAATEEEEAPSVSSSSSSREAPLSTTSAATKAVGFSAPASSSSSSSSSHGPHGEVSHGSGPEVHVVFSTDCGSYQHWQSIAVWYSAKYAGHVGAVTRIASGCDEAKKAPIEKEYGEIDDTGSFRVHFAPKGELKGNYKYSNKPSGLYHWLSTARPPPFRDERTGVVALIDPDQMLLRPLTTAVAAGLTRKPTDRRSMYDERDGTTSTPRILVGNLDRERLPLNVVEGRPAAQEYGIGGAWANAGKPEAKKSWRTFSKAKVCGEGAPCTTTLAREADAHYSVGPPYLIQATDARKLARAWLLAVPEVHEQYPYLLAEMYAYAMAAANLSLPHAQLHNLMVSNVQAGGEGWDWIDTADPADVCKGATLSTPPLSTRYRRRPGDFANDEHPPGPAAPTVLHFCQSYRSAGFKFGKHSVPHDVFSCDQGLFDFDPDKVTEYLVENAKRGAGNPQGNKANIRNAYFLCNVIPRMNAFILDYKQTVCPKRGKTTWNTKPTVKA